LHNNMPNPHRYFIVHKPFNMVSQFVSTHAVRLLGDIDFDFPAGTHAIGRLDSNSEGLLILTTNKKVTKLLFESKTPHKRTYIVQVKNVVSDETVEKLRNGVEILIHGNVLWTTTPCAVEMLGQPDLPFQTENELTHPIPHSWLKISLTEGKYHQVRKMVFAVGHKCRRLIRVSIEDLLLGDLQPGQVKEMDEADFFRLLNVFDY
jgi:23S rRNA pseudouridine2457 synthase